MQQVENYRKELDTLFPRIEDLLTAVEAFTTVFSSDLLMNPDSLAGSYTGSLAGSNIKIIDNPDSADTIKYALAIKYSDIKKGDTSTYSVIVFHDRARTVQETRFGECIYLELFLKGFESFERCVYGIIDQNIEKKLKEE